MYTIGIDVGGMSIKIGVVDANGKILIQDRFKTENTADVCVDKMVDMINALLVKLSIDISSIRGIGVGCPGSVEREKGLVKHLPNLNWYDYPLVEKLKKSFNVEIIISNDANVATLAETIYGSAKNFNTSVMFTLGTGVGGGVVIDKKLYEGGCSQGTELGHLTLVLGGLACTCGRRGCIERYVSATALIGQTKDAMISDKNSLMWEEVNGDINNVNGKTAFECEKKGDITAKAVVDKYVEYLSESIMNMCNVFRPDVFILGGGISAQGENLTKRIDEYCLKFDYGYKGAPVPKLVTATLGNDAGIVGAAALLMQK